MKTRRIMRCAPLFAGAVLCVIGPSLHAQAPDPETERLIAGLDEPRGLRLNTDGVTPGYVLFSPLLSDTFYLIDNDGQVVHRWVSALSGISGYLRDNGNLLRLAREPEIAPFSGGGQSGKIEEYTFDGEQVWAYTLNNAEVSLHHDIEPLPNGNVLAIAWVAMSSDEVRQAGRFPHLIPESGAWFERILELEPRYPEGARIVWQWDVRDHLIQDFDSALENYGVVADHPELIDINGNVMPPTDEELEQLRTRGYIDADAEPFTNADFFHMNGIDYNAELDQIVVSSPSFNEIWIIDHSTTTAEAAGSSGGRRGRGGDLLYRFGNPRVYHRGEESDRVLGAQHDPRWVPTGYPGAGNLTIFNNVVVGPAGPHSVVLEFSLPVTADGGYRLDSNAAYGPAMPLWSYEAPGFFAPFISGAHRIRNGNTMITAGPAGRFFEVAPNGEVVWDYWSPYSGEVFMADGTRPQPVAMNVYAAFRATRIPADHPGLRGRRLAPLDPQPAIVPPTFPEP